MEAVIHYLTENPFIGIVLAALVVACIFFVMKKLIKLALIIAFVLLISGGATYHFARVEFQKRSEYLLRKAGRTFDDIRKDIPHKLDSAWKKLDSLR